MLETLTIITSLAIIFIPWLWVWIMPTQVISVKRLPLGGLGLALPGFIFLTKPVWNESTLRHELAHQRQFRKYSPLGAALLLNYYYANEFLRYRLKTGNSPSLLTLWHKNPLEIEANAVMADNTPLPRLKGWE